MIPTALLLTVSIIIGSLTAFLVFINWKIYKVSLEILDESILLRKAFTIDVGETEPKS